MCKYQPTKAAWFNDFIKINAIFSNPDFVAGKIYTVPVGINTGLNEEKYALAIAYLESQGMDVHNLEVSTWALALLKPSLYEDDDIINIFKEAQFKKNNF